MVWCFQDMFNEHSLGFQHDKAIHEENGMSKRHQKTPYTQLSRPTDMDSQVLETNCPATIQNGWLGKGNRPEMNQHLKTIQNSDDGEPKVFDGKLIVHKLAHLHPSTILSTKNPWAWLHTKHFPFGTFSESPILQSCGRHGAGHLVVMSISSMHFSAFLRN